MHETHVLPESAEGETATIPCYLSYTFLIRLTFRPQLAWLWCITHVITPCACAQQGLNNWFVYVCGACTQKSAVWAVKALLNLTHRPEIHSRGCVKVFIQLDHTLFLYNCHNLRYLILHADITVLLQGLQKQLKEAETM